MDTDALRTFLAVHRHEGFSDAARILGRTQPAISSRIRLLEQDLGVRLFERTASGIVLSQAGRVLLRYAERAVAAVEDAESAVRSLKTEVSGPLTLAIVGTLANQKLTGVLKQFAARNASVEFEIQTARSSQISELVRRGEAVAGIRYDRDPSKDLHCEELGKDELVVVCAPDHRYAGRSIASLSILKQERWVAFPESPGQQGISASHIASVFLLQGLGEIKWSPIDSLTAQKRLVEAGFGLALTTRSNVSEEIAGKTLRIIKVGPLGPGQPIHLVTRKGGFLSGAAASLIDLLRRQYMRKPQASRDVTSREVKRLPSR